MLLNYQWVNEKSKRQSKNIRVIKIETQQFKSLGCSKNSSKREVYRNTGLHQETISQMNNLTFTYKI